MKIQSYISILLLACAFGACSNNEGDSGVFPHSVYICQPKPQDGSASLSFSGVVKENDNISLGFKAAGEIKRIFVKEGDRVKAGQLLAELDDADYRLGVDALQIQYDQVSQEVERARRLLENKSMSQNDYDKAAAGLKQLGVQLQANKNKLSYTRLYALVSGIVETVNYSKAEMVDAGTPVLTLMTTGEMEVTCDIPASAYAERERFTDFYCRSSYLGDWQVPLRLVSIIPKADNSQLYRMKLAFVVSLEKPATAGMNVEVNILMSDGNDSSALLVPSSALFTKEDKEYVWVMGNDSTVSERHVITDGSLQGSMVRVTEGLTATDNVVRAGVSMLSEGEKVKVIEKPSKSNVGGLL